MKKPRDAEKLLARKRAERYLYTVERRLRQSRRTTPRHHAPPVPSAYNSLPLSLLNVHRIGPIRGAISKTFAVKIPETFSVIENPRTAIQTFIQFAAATSSNRIQAIRFNHDSLKKVDLAAESILDFIVMERRREFRSRRADLQFFGKLPTDNKLQRYLRSVGIIKNLQVTHEYLPVEEENKLRVFQMRNKKTAKPHSVSDADYKERAVTDFVKHIDDCLVARRRRLTPDAKSALAVYTGEILANAEEHSDLDDWTIVGYLDTAEPLKTCEIAIFNFGKTFAETFSSLPKDSYAWKEVEPYIAAHKSKGLLVEGWNEKDLLTLVALQGNISSKNQKAGDDRGTGTIHLIEFFQQIQNECAPNERSSAKMCVLSGTTHILFDGKYRMKTDRHDRMVIAFNEENDLSQRPDKTYITSLGDVYFPGTIISIMFPLQDMRTESV